MWQESWSEIRKKFKVYPWSTGMKILGEGLIGQFSCQQRKPIYSPIHYCAWEESVKIPQAHGRGKLIGLWTHPNIENWIEPTGCRRSSSGNFPRIHHCADSRRDPEHDDSNTERTWAIYRKNSLHVNVQRHCIANSKIVCSRICEKSRARTFVVSRAWTRKGVVRNPHVQTECKMRSERWGHDAQHQWKRTFRIPCVHRFWNEIWKSKRNLSLHFCGDDDTAEVVVLRTIVSVNQPSVHGAVAEMCDELTCTISGCSESTGKLLAQNNSDTMVTPTELSTTN